MARGPSVYIFFSGKRVVSYHFIVTWAAPIFDKSIPIGVWPCTFPASHQHFQIIQSYRWVIEL
jgi:hypothetical protein